MEVLGHKGETWSNVRPTYLWISCQQDSMSLSCKPLWLSVLICSQEIHHGARVWPHNRCWRVLLMVPVGLPDQALTCIIISAELVGRILA